MHIPKITLKSEKDSTPLCQIALADPFIIYTPIYGVPILYLILQPRSQRNKVVLEQLKTVLKYVSAMTGWNIPYLEVVGFSVRKWVVD